MREITATSSRPKGITFVQWDKSTIKPHRDLIQKNHVSAVILDLFVEHIDRSNTVIVSKKTIMEIIGYSRPTIDKAIKVLEFDKWVQVIKIGSASAYKINHVAFWQGKQCNQYSTFSSSVIVSANEQSNETIELKEGDLKKVPIVHKDEILITAESECVDKSTGEITLKQFDELK